MPLLCLNLFGEGIAFCNFYIHVPSLNKNFIFFSIADFQHSVAGRYFLPHAVVQHASIHQPEIQHEQFSLILHPYRRIFTFAHGDYFYCRMGNRFFNGNFISHEADDSFKVDVITLHKISLHQFQFMGDSLILALYPPCAAIA